MLLLHMMAVVIRKIEHDPGNAKNALVVLLDFWWVLWFGFPFLVGSTAVAEERKLGTLECQLCLPVTRRAQFALKLVVTLVLGTALGGVMPWVAEGCWTGGHGQLHEFGNGTGFLPPVMLTCLVAAGTTVISFYASTLMRNLLQAMGAAVVIGFQLVYLSLFRSDPPPWGITLIGYVALPVTLAVLLGLAFKNYSHLRVGWKLWRRNLLTVFASLSVAVTAAAAVYQRP